MRTASADSAFVLRSRCRYPPDWGRHAPRLWIPFTRPGAPWEFLYGFWQSDFGSLDSTQPARQRQVRPLGWVEIKKSLGTVGKKIRADRERALLCVAYDTKGRRNELNLLDVEDLAFTLDLTGIVLIRRSRTDKARKARRRIRRCEQCGTYSSG